MCGVVPQGTVEKLCVYWVQTDNLFCRWNKMNKLLVVLYQFRAALSVVLYQLCTNGSTVLAVVTLLTASALRKGSTMLCWWNSTKLKRQFKGTVSGSLVAPLPPLSTVKGPKAGAGQAQCAASLIHYNAAGYCSQLWPLIMSQAMGKEKM